MKNARVALLLVAAVLLICGAVFWHSRSTSMHDTTQANTPASGEGGPKKSGLSQHSEDTNAFTQASEEQRREFEKVGITPGMTKEQMHEKITNWYQAQHERMADKWRNPINFYGKVIDENTNPVAGASVVFIWNDTSPTGSSKSSATSDENGSFSLTGVTGRGLSVYVEKSGYYYVKRGSQNDFDFSEGFIADSANPIIFRLQKKGPGADLITSQHGVSPVIQINLPHQGTTSPVHVDFFSQKVGNDGQLEISQNKPAYGSWQAATSWSYRLAVPNGGLLETSEEFPFEAPDAGYQPVIEFNFQKGDTNWTERIDKTFYVAFGNPRKYGRIHVETSMTTGTILDYAINPSGSKMLEPK